MAGKGAKKRGSSLESAARALKRHFPRVQVSTLITASHEYPIPARVDLQRAIDELLPGFAAARQSGIHVEYAMETLTLGHLLGNDHARVVVGPLQYEEIDVGETLPFRCVRRSVWFAKDGRMPFALILGPATRYGQPRGTSIEVVVPQGNKGADLARRVLDNIDTRVQSASSYRGRVISLGSVDRYTGAMGAIRVHKLKRVTQDQLVLPPRTVELLNRNVVGFVEQREKLKALGLPAKKGLLFYGPPGTGKTHTIHYLAARLPQHTTLLITAEEVGHLEQYFQLARFLQPSMLVIEDADLIARSREQMGGACEEVLLNKLLNEMDGLREDAEILFILTTNRPEQIEAALASRPGRIDQAIEFPLPDDDGRRQLAKLYACGLEMSPQVVETIVRKTDGASGALIKELMRRAAQFLVEAGDTRLQSAHVDAALEEMLFQGGSLNAKLLGGSAVSCRPN
jgi:hypothetical protein